MYGALCMMLLDLDIVIIDQLDEHVLDMPQFVKY
jgi:hypothetical protein